MEGQRFVRICTPWHLSNRAIAFIKKIVQQRRNRDEDDVQKVIGVIKSWANPFENSEDLVCLSSGARVTDEITRDLLQAHSEGEKAAKAFMEERLISNNTDFF